MTIYIVILALLLAVYALFCVYKPSPKKQKAALLLGSLILFFAAALRYGAGHDYFNYGNSFIGIVNGVGSVFGTEPGFGFITALLSSFTGSFIVYHMFFAALFAVFLYLALKYLSAAPFLGLIFYYMWGFYFNSYNFLRQIMAAFIFLLALKYAAERNPVRFVLFTLLASCFHFSAIFLLLAYIPFRIRLGKALLAVYAVVTAVSLAVSDVVVQFVTENFYPAYRLVRESGNVSVEILNGLSPVYSILFALIFIAAFVNRAELYEKSKYGVPLVQSAFFLTFFEIIGAKHAIISRMSIYFGLICAVVLLPLLYSVFAGEFRARAELKRKLTASGEAVPKASAKFVRMAVSFAVLNAGALTFFCYALYDNYNTVVPYQWIWSLL